jgi:hypothetical protein
MASSVTLPPQVATDALVEMERAMARDKIATNDRQVRGAATPFNRVSVEA